MEEKREWKGKRRRWGRRGKGQGRTRGEKRARMRSETRLVVMEMAARRKDATLMHLSPTLNKRCAVFECRFFFPFHLLAFVIFTQSVWSSFQKPIFCVLPWGRCRANKSFFAHQLPEQRRKYESGRVLSRQTRLLGKKCRITSKLMQLQEQLVTLCNIARRM